MIEIAEELERLAAFYEQEEKTREELRAEAKRCWDELDMSFQHGQAEMCADVARHLKERAAELRAQRSGSTYKPLAKPESVDARQWWAYRYGDGALDVPGRLEVIADRVANGRTESGTRWTAIHLDMLTDPNWLYLGDGPEPAR
jgi:hypothetical protein